MSLLAENQPLEEDKPGQGSYQPKPEEQSAIKLVNTLFEESKEGRKVYGDEKWLDYYHMFRGKQWKGNRPSYRHSEVINLVWQHIQSCVPIITDSKPRFDFLAEEPSDIAFAEILSQIASGDWDRNGWGLKLTEIIYDGHFYGTSFGEVGYDPDAKRGQGSATFGSSDTFFMFPDPDAYSLKEKCDYVIKAEPVPLKKLKREYPHVAEFLKADLIDLQNESKHELKHPKFKSPAETPMVLDMSSGQDVANKDKALKLTAYIKDYTTEEIEEPVMGMRPVMQPASDPVTGMPLLDPTGMPAMQPVVDPATGQPQMEEFVERMEFVTRLKYPNGRKIVVAGGVLCEDGQYPFDDEGDFHPFARFVNYIDPRSMWGVSEIEPLVSPQMIFNKTVSWMLDVFAMTGNPIWVIDDTSGVDEENLVNRSGLVVTKAQGSEVRREPGLDINPSLFQLVDRVKNWFNDESGSQDVSRGVRPEGITAMGAIQSLQEAAQTRLRLKSRNLDDFLQTVGQKYRNRVMQFYSVPRVYRITNKQGAEQYFKFHIETAEDGTKVASVRDFQQDPATGKYSEALETRQFVLRGDLDTRATTGSSLPFAKTEKSNLAMAMFDRGAIDHEELLNAVDYPNKERVLQRMQEKAAMQAQQAAMMGQPPMEGAPAAPAPTGQPV